MDAQLLPLDALASSQRPPSSSGKNPPAAWALSTCSGSALTCLPFTLETRCSHLTWWEGLCLQSLGTGQALVVGPWEGGSLSAGPRATSAALCSWAGRPHKRTQAAEVVSEQETLHAGPPSRPFLALLIINHKLWKEAGRGGLRCLPQGVTPTDWESLYLHSHMNDFQARAGMLTS